MRTMSSCLATQTVAGVEECPMLLRGRGADGERFVNDAVGYARRHSGGQHRPPIRTTLKELHPS